MTEYEFPQEPPGNEFDDDVNSPDNWRTPCCGADYDCVCP
jgi:hypothetical protein